MARAFRIGNFTLYVWDERGAQHHRAHAHIYERKRHVASVFLETLTIYDARDQLPKELIKMIAAEQELLLRLWTELNADV